MGTVLPIDICDVDEFEVGLVDEGSGLEEISLALVAWWCPAMRRRVR
jgi:hypothetical protein